MIINWEML